MLAASFRSEGGAVRIALAVIVPVAAALLQSSLAPSIAIGGARPNMLILFAGSWSVAVGAAEGVWWAFVAGIAADLISGGPLGALALSSLAPVAAIGAGERSAARPTPVLIGAGLVGVATLATGLAYVGILSLVGQALPDLGPLLVELVVGATYTGVLALAVYPAFRGLRRITEQESPF